MRFALTSSSTRLVLRQRALPSSLQPSIARPLHARNNRVKPSFVCRQSGHRHQPCTPVLLLTRTWKTLTVGLYSLPIVGQYYFIRWTAPLWAGQWQFCRGAPHLTKSRESEREKEKEKERPQYPPSRATLIKRKLTRDNDYQINRDRRRQTGKKKRCQTDIQ